MTVPIHGRKHMDWPFETESVQGREAAYRPFRRSRVAASRTSDSAAPTKRRYGS